MTSYDCEYGDPVAWFGSACRQVVGGCSNHRSSHLILVCVRFAIIFFENRSQIDALSLS